MAELDRTRRRRQLRIGCLALFAAIVAMAAIAMLVERDRPAQITPAAPLTSAEFRTELRAHLEQAREVVAQLTAAVQAPDPMQHYQTFREGEEALRELEGRVPPPSPVPEDQALQSRYVEAVRTARAGAAEARAAIEQRDLERMIPARDQILRAHQMIEAIALELGPGP